MMAWKNAHRGLFNLQICVPLDGRAHDFKHFDHLSLGLPGVDCGVDGHLRNSVLNHMWIL